MLKYTAKVTWKPAESQADLILKPKTFLQVVGRLKICTQVYARPEESSKDEISRNFSLADAWCCEFTGSDWTSKWIICKTLIEMGIPEDRLISFGLEDFRKDHDCLLIPPVNFRINELACQMFKISDATYDQYHQARLSVWDRLGEFANETANLMSNEELSYWRLES